MLFLLGLLDVLAGISILLIKYGILIEIVIVILTLFFIKTVIFIRSFASIIDLFALASILLLFFGYDYFFTWLFFIWLIQKGLFSFF